MPGLLLLLCGAFTSAAVADDDRDALLREAFLFAFPVHEMARTRASAVSRTGNLNSLRHRTTLSDASHRNVTTPNNDTLYSSSWLDLSAGPVILTTPTAPDRYHSVALMDMFTDHFAVLGTRRDGGQGKTFFIHGPRWSGTVPVGMEPVRAPMDDAWLIVRVLVRGDDDLDAARAVQSAFRLEAAPGSAAPLRPDGGAQSPDDDPASFLDGVNAALGRGPLPPVHAARVARFADVGIRPGEAGVWRSLDAATRDAWLKSFRLFRDGLRNGLRDVGPSRNGWSYPASGIGEFGTDDLYRSRVALGGLGALPQAEAVYLSSRTDSLGKPLQGLRPYCLTLPAAIPVGAFWSLSLYEIAPDGRLFFTANPLGRYAIGSETRAIVRDRDGGISVRMQHAAPDASEANWLPAPAGAYALTFRAYLPGRGFVTAGFEMPPVGPCRTP
jgi:hypothetical protein